MKRALILVYSIAAYAVSMATIVYAVGFVANLAVPKSIDIGGATSEQTGWAAALLVNLALLTLFAAQHSIMARPGFKRAWTRVVPEAAERSTYVLAASLVLTVLFWFWTPMPLVLWDVAQPGARAAILAVYALGWFLVVFSTFLINHFELFGLSQGVAAWRRAPAPKAAFVMPLLYRLVRHPLYLGFLLAFWAAPTMTLGHLVFSVATTGYILLGIFLEERDLIAEHGDSYRRYRERVRMLLPLPVSGAAKEDIPGRLPAE